MRPRSQKLPHDAAISAAAAAHFGRGTREVLRGDAQTFVLVAVQARVSPGRVVRSMLPGRIVRILPLYRS